MQKLIKQRHFKPLITFFNNKSSSLTVQHLALCIVNIACYTPDNEEEKHLK